MLLSLHRILDCLTVDFRLDLSCWILLLLVRSARFPACRCSISPQPETLTLEPEHSCLSNLIGRPNRGSDRCLSCGRVSQGSSHAGRVMLGEAFVSFRKQVTQLSMIITTSSATITGAPSLAPLLASASALITKQEHCRWLLGSNHG